MPDITMCLNKKCRVRLKCYRFTATPNSYGQSYFLEGDIGPDKTTGICEYFLAAEAPRTPTTKRRKKIRR